MASNKRKLDLSKGEERDIALQWLEESDDDYLSDRDDYSSESEPEDNLEVEESEPEMLQVLFKLPHT